MKFPKKKINKHNDDEEEKTPAESYSQKHFSEDKTSSLLASQALRIYPFQKLNS